MLDETASKISDLVKSRYVRVLETTMQILGTLLLTGFAALGAGTLIMRVLPDATSPRTTRAYPTPGAFVEPDPFHRLRPTAPSDSRPTPSDEQ